MCAGCSAMVPVCAVDGTCGSTLIQNIKIAALGAMPVMGGVAVWAQTKIIKRKRKKTSEEK